ncbi:hypothetical protein PRIPAC_87586 [Pristionchus pacificus]|uniref:Uncharacterized protein n=1 Tax=Pristionchus pacificus TaxID=54126 RepID=A0A2A6B6K1_PRIPA|nr:hypothetical protein PRIPAC_87586 [Pristionchus pacificus]|eukprot:PDM61494.1 hypothetical protein PRIPAC_50936 [Pristionchus pacificus]
MADHDGDDAQRKAAEREAKKAEVRKRLEEAGKAGKKAKKGFLTPERKKKLRKLLMSKAAEDLKRQQLAKEQERQKALADRTIPCPQVDGIEDKAKLEAIYNELFEKVRQLESEKYDINALVNNNQNVINQLNIEVNDLRGKYAKPALKKVSKYDNKFKKMATEGEAKTAPKADFRSNLKVVKKENAVEEILAKVEKKKDGKPEWSKKGGEKKEEEEKEVKEEKAKVEEAAPEEEEPSEAPEVEEEEDEEEEEEEEE